MYYGEINKNDFTAAPGVSVTLFVSGCHFHCPGCHNPEAQNFNYGKYYTLDNTFEIIEALQANGLNRNLCLMGGEPLAPENREQIAFIIMDVRNALPEVPIYLWTGYTYEDLKHEITDGKWPEPDLDYILNHIDYLIDGPFAQEQRDITLKMRGSRNQRILRLENGRVFEEL